MTKLVTTWRVTTPSRVYIRLCKCRKRFYCFLMSFGGGFNTPESDLCGTDNDALILLFADKKIRVASCSKRC